MNAGKNPVSSFSVFIVQCLPEQANYSVRPKLLAIDSTRFFRPAAQLLDFAGIDFEQGREPSPGPNASDVLFHVCLVPSQQEGFPLADICSSFDENREFLLKDPRLEEKDFDDMMSHVGLQWVRLRIRGQMIQDNEDGDLQVRYDTVICIRPFASSLFFDS